MTNEKLIQATMLALTKQNVTPRPAPLSTAIMEGMVINRNIGAGEPVVCYYNDAGELLRIGDVPTHNGDFFVDENNRMYDTHDGVLRIQNALSGELYGDTTSAYGFQVVNGGQCAAYKTQNDVNAWRVIYPDGEMSGEIVFDFAYTPKFGWRNGVLAVAYTTGSYSGLKGQLFTYTKDGTLITELPFSTSSHFYVFYLAPINPTSVAIEASYIAGFLDFTYYRYYISSITGLTSYYPWEGYDTSSGTYVSFGYDEGFLGFDQSYGYTSAKLYEDIEVSEGVTEHTYIKTAIARFSIDNYSGIEIIYEYEDPNNQRTLYRPPDSYGNAIFEYVEEGQEVCRMVDILTMQKKYINDLPNLPGTNIVRENTGWIWIDGYGVFQKTWLGWLMYASSTYPRSAPWGRLGYAVAKANIGELGKAIVVFE